VEVGSSGRAVWCVGIHNVKVLMNTKSRYTDKAGHLVLAGSRSAILFPVNLCPVLRRCDFVVSCVDLM
jgi:hypothetical protein